MIVQNIKQTASKAITELYGVNVAHSEILVNATKPEFAGDYTVVLFALIKQLKKSPEALGNEIGEYLVKNNQQLFSSFNVIKGFLNLVVTDNFWLDFLQQNYSNEKFGLKETGTQKQW